MPVTKINFQQSAELAKEMEFFSGTSDGEKIFSAFKNSSDLRRHMESSNEYLDIARVRELCGTGSALDVGVGYGLTAAYLALSGFQVMAVEPSVKLCEDMEKNFARLGIGAKIVSATGESLDKLAGPYDVIVFYSSLHHCDDVLKALQNSFALLRPGGKVFLFEPVLKFYRSKAWFYRELELHPENVGHYGGNEHIYRYGEYVNYLEQAGFKNLRAVPSAAYARVPKRAPWDSVARYAIKRIYFWLVRNILMQIPLVPRLLMQLSLINPVLVAEKV